MDLRIETLKRSWLFCDLPPDELREMTASAVFRRFRKGELIFRQGDPPQFLYVIGSGKVKQFKTCSSGRGFTTVVNSCGDPLNVAAFFGVEAHFVTTQAMSDTRALSIAKKEFFSFIERHPVVMTRILHAMGLIINSAYERLSDLAGETASQRVLNVLYMLHYKFGDTVPFTRGDCGHSGDYRGNHDEGLGQIEGCGHYRIEAGQYQRAR